MKWIIGLAVLLGGGYWVTTNWNSVKCTEHGHGACMWGNWAVGIQKGGGTLPTLEFTSLPGGVQYSNASDLEELEMEAELSHKPILLFYVTSSCGYCKLMKEKVFTDPEVAEFLSQQVLIKPVQIDETESDGEAIKSWRTDATKLVKSHGIQAAPTFALCRSDGKRVAQAVGAMDKEKFLGWLKENLAEAI